MDKVTTRQQKMARIAFQQVSEHGDNGEYASFAKSFPALLQTAGLCQAVAFAKAKGKDSGPPTRVLTDVAITAILFGDNEPHALNEICSQSREAEVTDYLRLSRVVIQAATWIKRYVEALEVSGDE